MKEEWQIRKLKKQSGTRAGRAQKGYVKISLKVIAKGGLIRLLIRKYCSGCCVENGGQEWKQECQESLHICTQSASALFPRLSHPDLTSSHYSLATLLQPYWSVGCSSYIPHRLSSLGLCTCCSLCQQHPSIRCLHSFLLYLLRFSDNATLRRDASECPR